MPMCARVHVPTRINMPMCARGRVSTRNSVPTCNDWHAFCGPANAQVLNGTPNVTVQTLHPPILARILRSHMPNDRPPSQIPKCRGHQTSRQTSWTLLILARSLRSIKRAAANLGTILAVHQTCSRQSWYDPCGPSNVQTPILARSLRPIKRLHKCLANWHDPCSPPSETPQVSHTALVKRRHAATQACLSRLIRRPLPRLKVS